MESCCTQQQAFDVQIGFLQTSGGRVSSATHGPAASLTCRSSPSVMTPPRRGTQRSASCFGSPYERRTSDLQGAATLEPVDPPRDLQLATTSVSGLQRPYWQASPPQPEDSAAVHDVESIVVRPSSWQLRSAAQRHQRSCLREPWRGRSMQ